jgi:hypothetical protein
MEIMTLWVEATCKNKHKNPSLQGHSFNVFFFAKFNEIFVKKGLIFSQNFAKSF